MAALDLKDQRFTRWTVIRRAEKQDSPGRIKWLCVCECGVERDVDASNLRTGLSRSCGCLAREITSAKSRTHGLGDSTMYWRWANMIHRCYVEKNRSYHRYGGRGISVCDRWRFGIGAKSGMELFYADMGDPPFPGASLDRIDNDGNYEPENCRWADSSCQVQNSTISKLTAASVRRIKQQWGQGRSIVDLAAEYGVSQNAVRAVVKNKSWRNVEAVDRMLFGQDGVRGVL